MHPHDLSCWYSNLVFNNLNRCVISAHCDLLRLLISPDTVSYPLMCPWCLLRSVLTVALRPEECIDVGSVMGMTDAKLETLAKNKLEFGLGIGLVL